MWIVAGVALLLQMLYLAESSRDPTLAFPLLDAGVYHEEAQRLAAGQPPADGAFFQPPLFPVVLGVLYRVAGVSIFAARLFQATCATVSCVLLAAITWRLFGRTAGLLAGLMLAAYGPFLFFTSQLLPTTPAILLNLLGLWWLLLTLTRPAAWRYLVFGFLVGLATITVPNSVMLFVIALGALVGQMLRPPWRRHAALRPSDATPLPPGGEGRVRGEAAASRPLTDYPQAGKGARSPALSAVLAAVGLALPIAPVTIYNYIHSREFVLIANNGGVNFYIGNNASADRTEAVRPGHRWYQLYGESVTGGAQTAGQRNAYFSRRAWEYVRTDPLGFLGGLARKSWRLVNARELPRTFDLYSYRDFSRLLSVLVWRTDWFAFPLGVVLPLAAAGMVLAPALARATGGPARLWVVPLMFAVLYGASVMLFFVSARHRLPAVVMLLPYAAGGLIGLGRQAQAWWTGGHAGAALPTSPTVCLAAVVVLLAVVVLVNLPVHGPLDDFNFRAERYHTLAQALADAKELDLAAELAARSIALDPTYAAGCAGLGLIRARQGDLPEAETLFRRALELDPEAAEVHWYLANALLEQGRAAEALAAGQRSLAINPSSPEAHGVVGDILLHLKRADEAIEHYQQALRLPPYHPELRFALAAALEQAERYGEALANYRQGLYEAGPRPGVVHRLVTLLLTCPRAEWRSALEAAMLAEHWVQATQRRDAAALELLADVQLAHGRQREAQALLTEAIRVAEEAGDEARAASLRSRAQGLQAALP